MATQPIDVIPCKLKQLFPQRKVENGNVTQFENSEYWNTIVSSYNGSNITDTDSSETSYNATLNAFLQYGYSSSTIVDFNSTFENLTTSVKLQPADSLITHPVYLSLTVASILGNLAMLSVILFTPQFRKPANYLIVNLSLSSIFFILSANLRLIENAYELWDYTTLRCRLLAVLHRLPIPCVALTTMLISVDRGRVARNPMTSTSTSSPAWKILFIWSFSLVIVLPLAFTRKYDECIPTAHKCAKVLLFGRSSLSMIYGIAYLLSVHIIPAAILIRESVKTQKIMKFLKLSNIEHLNQQLRCEITPYSSSLPDNRLRLLRNSCLFTTIFLVCWLPYGIFQFPLDLPKEILPELLEIYVRFYFRFVRNFSYLQIALNPVALFALSYDLRMYLTRVRCDWSERMGRNNGTGCRYNQRRAVQTANSQP